MAPTDTEFKAIQRRMRSGAIVKPFRGLYAQTDYWNALDRYERIRHIVRALAKRHPDWVFSGPTAAVMHRLDCSYRLAWPLHVVGSPDAHYRNTSRLRRYVISDPEVVELEGVKVTGLLRTLFDCAATLDLRYSLAPIDSSVRSGFVDKDVLLAYPSSVKYSSHRRTVMRAFDLADARSENGGESSARGMLHDMGCPPDDIQVEFPCLDYPNRRHRVDFLWRISRDGTSDDGQVALEFDGTRKYVDPDMTSGRAIREVVDDERRRQQCLERQGLSVVRMHANELDAPWRVIHELEEQGVRRTK
ncbi:CTP synthase [Bifidobacterium parmae]|uniref:CTP synthase n=1 Tax=Bifidobacterium parmae TaxID=361854 RepID=A0A2N5J0C4_9BIFI|nr:CTP synthase [Bifidobacterium parmae]